MERKIVFFDIDGTLVTKDKQVPPAVKQAILSLQQNGIYVAIATGRPLFLFQDLCKELHINSYVCFSGQYVVWEGNVLYENPIAAEEVARLQRDAAKQKHPMIFMTKDEMKATVGEHPYVTAGLDKLKFAYPAIDPHFSEGQKIYQALLFCLEEAEAGMICPKGNSRFIRWHEYACDVLPNGGSKAVGIQKLLDAADISATNCYAFGDGPNDIEMLELAGVGVAMGDAVPALKAVADHITDTAEEDGIVKGLKAVGLLQ